ncbi:helix-turn-helix domain-containing protein [Paludisphaera soli]|uniref:helix-turn-helix domain-containing protein n=1 Tax=Paludisphaera soli TaxID=2712865 RepID=UPI0013EA7ED4|nr:helix-turn-helix domain-containing protein [Paludisphaera soli]
MPKEAPKKPRGQPSAYRPEMAAQAEKLARLGATDKELADFFDVSERTISNWKKQHPEFLQSLKDGKIASDAAVADRLFKRAMGYSHKAVKLFNHNGKIVKADYVQHYPPDTAAAIFWLKNRRPDRWRDKPPEAIDDGGDDSGLEIPGLADELAGRHSAGAGVDPGDALS